MIQKLITDDAYRAFCDRVSLGGFHRSTNLLDPKRSDSLIENTQLLPKTMVFGEQINLTTPEYALYGLVSFYGISVVLNWWFDLRLNA